MLQSFLKFQKLLKLLKSNFQIIFFNVIFNYKKKVSWEGGAGGWWSRRGRFFYRGGGGGATPASLRKKKRNLRKFEEEFELNP